MSTPSTKASDAQIAVAAEIEQSLSAQVVAAQNVDLRFLVYLMEMVLDEASSIARGRVDIAEAAPTLSHK